MGKVTVKSTVTTPGVVQAVRKIKNNDDKVVPLPAASRVKKLFHCHDFAGLGATSTVLKEICDALDSKTNVHLFSCDTLKASLHFKMHVDPPMFWYKNVLKRAFHPEVLSKKGSIDHYSFTSPCQGLSQAGLQLGADDPRTRLALVSVIVLEKLLPKTWSAEQVWTLASQKRYKKFFDFLLASCKEVGTAEYGGYIVHWRILNSSNFVPQNRPRLYMYGIRKDCMRKNSKGVPTFPVPPPKSARPSLRELLAPVPTAKFKMFPSQEDAGGLHHRNVMDAYETLLPGVNPFVTPVIVDYKSSRRFSTCRVEECMALTKTRASQRGYWGTTKGGPLEVDELAQIQGYSSATFPWKAAGLSEAAAGACLGNGQTLPLVRHLLPTILFHGSVITFEEFTLLSKRSLYG